jgi:hypothetical protein
MLNSGAVGFLLPAIISKLQNMVVVFVVSIVSIITFLKGNS